MIKDRFQSYIDCFTGSFQDILLEMSGLRVEKCKDAGISSERKYSVIVGIVLANKGRVLFEADRNLVDRITEGMNGEPLGNIMYTYFYLAEFTNIFCGKAVSKINNLYKDSELRLTPPALFVGSNMRIITPSIHSEAVFYASQFGQALLDMGIEGA